MGNGCRSSNGPEDRNAQPLMQALKEFSAESREAACENREQHERFTGILSVLTDRTGAKKD